LDAHSLNALGDEVFNVLQFKDKRPSLVTGLLCLLLKTSMISPNTARPLRYSMMPLNEESMRSIQEHLNPYGPIK